MKLESLKKFQENSINKIEMSNVNGGNTRQLSDSGLQTGGAAEHSVDGQCVSWTSDWEELNGVVSYTGLKVYDKSLN